MQLFTEYCTDIHFFSYNFYQNLFFLPSERKMIRVRDLSLTLSVGEGTKLVL